MSTAPDSPTIVSLHAITDVGRYRSHNEDNYIACPDLSKKEWSLPEKSFVLSDKGCLLVVADGMGGTNAGEVASKFAVDSLQQSFNAIPVEKDFTDSEAKECLQGAIMEAHKAITESSFQNPEHKGMGTTLVAAWVFPGKAFIGWVGDSRAYLYQESEGLKLLTKDHSLVWEMVEAGEITPDEADVHPRNNIITQSLGDARHPPQPGFLVCVLEKGDRLLLCTDGLNNMINHSAIEKILAQDIPLAKINQKLVKEANEWGGEDNITVLSLEVMKNTPARQRLNKKSGLWFLSFSLLSLFFWWVLMNRSDSTPPPENEQKKEKAEVERLLGKEKESGAIHSGEGAGEVQEEFSTYRKEP